MKNVKCYFFVNLTVCNALMFVYVVAESTQSITGGCDHSERGHKRPGDPIR